MGRWKSVYRGPQACRMQRTVMVSGLPEATHCSPICGVPSRGCYGAGSLPLTWTLTTLTLNTQDPGADGPVIQAASTRALSAGTTLDAVLAMLAGVAPSLHAPVLIFTYYNPIMARGLDRFCRQVKDAGVSGELRPAVPLTCSKLRLGASGSILL